MGAVLALSVGVAVVIGGIVWLRQHAFVALLAAGLSVGLLTSGDSVFRSQLRGDALTIGSVGAGDVTLDGRRADLRTGEFVVYRPELGGRWISRATIEIESLDGRRAVLKNPGATLHRGDILVAPSAVESAQKVSRQSPVVRLVNGFGETCRKIGILIAMASIIGACLLDSGGATRIVAAVQRALGAKRAPAAFAVSGFTLGIPVYFDTVFFLLIPLAKALYRKTRQHYLLSVLAVVVGGTMAHSLVPPTPGPLFVAEELNVNLGLTILCGLVIGVLCSSVGYAYAWWLDRAYPVAPDLKEIEAAVDESANGDTRTPSLGLALTPIVLPVLLLGSVGVADFVGWQTSDSHWSAVVETLGDRNVALSIAAGVALLMLYRSKRDSRLAQKSIQSALAAGGVVILITAAGGAFGQMIRQTDIASQLAQWMPAGGSGSLLLVMAFLLTALVRVAQGSATVAMITTVGIVGPLAVTMDLAYHPVYLVMAIGCGSKPLPWMNDSGFWVVGRMSGLTTGETFRGFSLVLTVMGLVGLGATLLAAWLLPLR